jgi:hypothetical protein
LTNTQGGIRDLSLGLDGQDTVHLLCLVSDVTRVDIRLVRIHLFFLKIYVVFLNNKHTEPLILVTGTVH